MGRHAAQPATFDAVVDDYVTERARNLIREADTPGALTDHLDAAEWIGAATEILRELTRDA
jgi:hypothetical protein